MSESVSSVLAPIGTFILVALLTEVMRRIALRHRLVDRPGRGKGHAAPTPYLGGVAIAAGSLIVVVVAGQPRDGRISMLVAGGVMMAGLGLADDIWRLGVGPRLAVEALAAALVAAAGVRAGIIGDVPFLGTWPDTVFAVAWIVVITNSFNLLDNTDGAAAAIAATTAAAAAVLAFATGLTSLAVIDLVLSASCVAFLVHNWTPARIFMGDAGSLYLGFTLSASALLILGSPGTGSRPSRSCVLLLLAFVAIVDTSTVIVSRYRAGRPLFQGGTDHTAHRLRQLGLGTGQSVLTLSAVAALSCSAAIGVSLGVLPVAGALAIALMAAAILVAVGQRVRPYAQTGPPATQLPPAQSPAAQHQPGALEAAPEQAGTQQRSPVPITHAGTRS